MGLRVPTQPRRLSKPSSCLSHVTNIPLQTDGGKETRATFRGRFAATYSGQVPAAHPTAAGLIRRRHRFGGESCDYERNDGLNVHAHALRVLIQGILLLCRRAKTYMKTYTGRTPKNNMVSSTSTWTHTHVFSGRPALQQLAAWTCSRHSFVSAKGTARRLRSRPTLPQVASLSGASERWRQ